MATTIRAFYFGGIVTAKTTGKQLATDSVGLLKFPYLSRSSLTLDAVTAQSTSAAPAGAAILVIQVQAGKAAHIEINDPSRSTAADSGSYIISGEQTFAVGEGWSASLLEHEVV